MKLPNTAKKIKNAESTWIDIDGSVYTLVTNGPKPKKNKNYRLIKKIPYLNKTNGYMYIGIKFNNGYKTVRLHRLVATYFVKNPNHYNVVGHRNNIKHDCRAENLYWTSTSENTKKAYIDGLARNDHGHNDSQSMPVQMFKTDTNEYLGTYGSISEAARETGIPKNTISRQAKYHRPVRKEVYFRYADDESVKPLQEKDMRIYVYDYQTDKLLYECNNKSHASRVTGMCTKTITSHLINGKPKGIKSLKYYFTNHKL